MFSVCEHPPTLNLMYQDARYLQTQNDEPPVTQQPEKTPCNLLQSLHFIAPTSDVVI